MQVEFFLQTFMKLICWGFLTIGLSVDRVVPKSLDGVQEGPEDCCEGDEVRLQLGAGTEHLVKHWQTGLRERFIIPDVKSGVYLALPHDLIENLGAAGWLMQARIRVQVHHGKVCLRIE